MENNASKEEPNFVPPESMQNEAEKPVTPIEETPPISPKATKKTILVIIAIVLLLVGAGAAYWLFIEKTQDTANQISTNSIDQTTQQTETSTYTTPDTVIYVFKEGESPFTIYSRPASGGDRKELVKLSPDEYASHFDVRDNIVAYGTDEAIFVSTDSGSSFTKAYELGATTSSSGLGAQITSLKIDKDKSGIAFGLLPADGQKNQVTTIELTGGSPTTIFESDKRGVFIDAWSKKSNKIVYSEGCYNCDGNLLLPVLRDLTSNKVVQLAASAEPGTVVSIDANNDLSQVVLAYGKVDKSPQDGIGINIIAPYVVDRIDTSSQQTTTLATIGSAGEKNPNGTVRSRSVLAGFLDKSNEVFYTNDKELFKVNDKAKEGVLILTAQDKILQMPFFSKENILYTYGDPSTGDFNLMNYTTANKGIVQILSGDYNTQIFGVTTK